MTVAAGTRLGRYDITAPLGAGGMGEVWRARDSRLDRSVAIKILPQAFSADEQRRERFEREARAISQLTHPHICALYDIGHENGIDYLVMELLEGETLADRLLRSGPLPLPELIRYGSQIAEALHAAHRSGIVHRDLKPGNVMLTRSGAKLLDFGLARALDAASNANTPTEVMTAQKPLTAEGTVVGTVQYMSPEQLTGDTVDHRSDIFALGALLYEMATARRAFGGNTRTSVVSAIISSEPPPISSVQPLAPKSLERLIAACMSKDREDRVQSAHDVAVQLRWLATDAEPQAIAPQRKNGNWIPWTIAALCAAGALSAIAWMGTREAAPVAKAPAIRFTIPPPPQRNFYGIPAISPDGTRMVLNTLDANGDSLLWLRTADRFDMQPLPGTENASHVFWSPDGQQIGFADATRLQRLNLADGTIHSICALFDSVSQGASWGRGDVIVFAPQGGGPLHRVTASGGEPAPFTKAASGEAHGWPWFLPDGDHFLFRSSLGKVPGIYVGSLSSPEVKLLIAFGDIVGGRVAWSEGYIFYNREAALYAQKFNDRTLTVEGEPQKIVDGVEFNAPGRSAFSVSRSGTLVYHSASEPTVEQLVFVDRRGQELERVGPVMPYSDFRLAPDGRNLVFTRWGAVNASWMLDLARGAVTRISFERWSGFPVWLPDGKSVVYAAAVDRPPNLFLRRPNGSVQRLTTRIEDHYPAAVTPDGKFILTEFNNPPNAIDIVAVPVASPQTFTGIVTTRFDEREPSVSPDGTWLAYQSDESGEPQIYAIRYPDAGTRIQISTDGGREPRWSRDGRYLYYMDLKRSQLMEVAITVKNGELQATVPTPLFPYRSLNYDTARNDRFLLARPQLNPDAAPMSVLMNVTSTLR